MDRTLYLNENKRVTVLRDGPSIWVVEEGKSGRRIPARLIGRVVIIGNLRLDAGVITLFTDNHVPVTLMDRRGESTAVVMPYIDRLPAYYERQRACLATAERVRRFRDWLNAKRRGTQLYVINRLSRKAGRSFSFNGFRENDYRRVIEDFKPFRDQRWDAAFGVIANLMRELSIECIFKSDLDPHLGVIYRRHNFGLALDICHILEPEVELQCILFLKNAEIKRHMTKEQGKWAVSGDGMRHIAQRFESRRKAVQSIVERLLDEIFELMRDLRK